MSAIKTLTSVATAIALVAGIGIATAQSEEQPAQPMVQATGNAVTDPNALQQQVPAPTPVDPSLQQPAAPASASAATTPAYPAQATSGDTATMTPGTSSSAHPSSAREPAPRADRN